jgi:hypothetical protein
VVRLRALRGPHRADRVHRQFRARRDPRPGPARERRGAAGRTARAGGPLPRPAARRGPRHPGRSAALRDRPRQGPGHGGRRPEQHGLPGRPRDGDGSAVLAHRRRALGDHQGGRRRRHRHPPGPERAPADDPAHPRDAAGRARHGPAGPARGAGLRRGTVLVRAGRGPLRVALPAAVLHLLGDALAGAGLGGGRRRGRGPAPAPPGRGAAGGLRPSPRTGGSPSR